MREDPKLYCSGKWMGSVNVEASSINDSFKNCANGKEKVKGKSLRHCGELKPRERWWSACSYVSLRMGKTRLCFMLGVCGKERRETQEEEEEEDSIYGTRMWKLVRGKEWTGSLASEQSWDVSTSDKSRGKRSKDRPSETATVQRESRGWCKWLENPFMNQIPISNYKTKVSFY